MSDESVARKLDDQWRMACPNGHHRLDDMHGPTAYCEGCGHAYRYEELVDKKARDSECQSERTQSSSRPGTHGEDGE
jgi:hypothetical protein